MCLFHSSTFLGGFSYFGRSVSSNQTIDREEIRHMSEEIIMMMMIAETLPTYAKSAK